MQVDIQVDVAVKDIVVDWEFNFRDGMDEDTIGRYRDSAESLPPVTVFQVGDQLLLADGFHRLEALKRNGVETVAVHKFQGARGDVKEWAAISNATHGRPLTREERNRAIVWLYEYGTSTEDIGRKFRLSASMVSRIATEAGSRRRAPDIQEKAVRTREAHRVQVQHDKQPGQAAPEEPTTGEVHTANVAQFPAPAPVASTSLPAEAQTNVSIDTTQQTGPREAVGPTETLEPDVGKTPVEAAQTTDDAPLYAVRLSPSDWRCVGRYLRLALLTWPDPETAARADIALNLITAAGERAQTPHTNGTLEFKLVIAAGDDKLTIGVQRPLHDPKMYVHPAVAVELLGDLVIDSWERANAEWALAPRNPGYERPAAASAPARRAARATSRSQSAQQPEPPEQAASEAPPESPP